PSAPSGTRCTWSPASSSGRWSRAPSGPPVRSTAHEAHHRDRQAVQARRGQGRPRGRRRHRHDGHRGAGLRAPGGAHRGLPGRRVHDRPRAQGPHRRAGRRRRRRPPRRGGHRGRPHREDRRREAVGDRRRPRRAHPHRRARPGRPPMTIAATRAQLAADDTLVGRALCAAWTAAVDRWLAGLVDDALAGGDPRGVALAAVGGYGRAELSLQSAIAAVLLHAGRDDVGELADRIWYPVWDARLKLGHAVRTVNEALALAADDLDTATSLLQVRHLAGDPALTAELATKAELRWRKRPRRALAALAARVRERHRRVGEVAFLLEPDLKEGRGGLRDVHALDWAQAARSILWETDEAA